MIGWLASCAALAATSSQSVSSGVYTAEQAAAGETIYFDRCAECHGADLRGIEQAPPLVGSAFLDSWQGKTLRKLLERIESMPPDEPAVVSTPEAVDVLTFLLYAAEMPAGSARLPADRAALGRIMFERTEP